jgi:hypothetical protein
MTIVSQLSGLRLSITEGRHHYRVIDNNRYPSWCGWLYVHCSSCTSKPSINNVIRQTLVGFPSSHPLSVKGISVKVIPMHSTRMDRLSLDCLIDQSVSDGIIRLPNPYYGHYIPSYPRTVLDYIITDFSCIFLPPGGQQLVIGHTMPCILDLYVITTTA